MTSPTHPPPGAPDQAVRNIRIRPIRPDDWHRLQCFHRRLSMSTIELRFHGAKQELSEPLAHRFTQPDGEEEVALVATTGTRGRIVGVGRHACLGPATAEVAFVIEDAYQHHGLGRRLMTRLIQTAQAHGITEFIAEVLPGNTPMFRLLEEVGPTHTSYASGECTVRVKLTP